MQRICLTIILLLLMFISSSTLAFRVPVCSEFEGFLSEILSPLGIPTDTIDIVHGERIKFAMSTISNEGVWTILCDETSLESLSIWEQRAILAHEIGHFLLGHVNLVKGGLGFVSQEQHEIELAADKFSGFTLARLGATLDEAQLAVQNLSSDVGSQTFPSKERRLEAIEEGWYEYKCQYEDVPPGWGSTKCGLGWG